MTHIDEPARAENWAHLRDHAEALISEGAAAAARLGGGPLGVETLELLYRRASNPEFAADALKLLHELQTHQVELDLLLEQVQASESEITEELAHYQALFKLAPVAYLVISRNGRVIESNAAACELLGFAPEHSEEQTLTQYLAPPSRSTVANMIELLETPGAIETCAVELAGHPGSQLSIRASLSPSGEHVMMVVSPCPTPDTDPAQS